jgi:hypothetical protein
MFRASTAHHQEVRFMYVANGTSKMTVSSLTVILEVPYLLIMGCRCPKHVEVS